MSYEIIGNLHKVFDVESKSSSFQTREFVISVAEGTYNQYVKFQLVQDRCGIIDQFKEGSEVKVFFDLKGREWQGKYFTNLQAWKVDAVSKATDNGDSGFTPPLDQMDQYMPINDSNLEDDGLPF